MEGDDLISAFTYAIGGDKAYPHILFPCGWSLFVTMTSEEETAVQEAEKANRERGEILQSHERSVTFVNHTIKGDESRHRCQEIARSHSVVECVIRVMKSFLILSNISWVSKQTVDFVYRTVITIAALCNYNLEKRGTCW